MNRKDTTALLTEILIHSRIRDGYYAKEVTLDWGSDNPKRIDVMQFMPEGAYHISDIEKGTFTCYEVKSCVQDVYSGNGLNFYGEKNYIVTTMDTYKKLGADINSGAFADFMKERHPECCKSNFGVLVPIPVSIDLRKTAEVHEEYENPHEFGGNSCDWKLAELFYCFEDRRKRSMTELLFCMLRAKHNSSN